MKGPVLSGPRNPKWPSRWLQRDRLVAATVSLAVLGMLGLAFASVPLYRMFCAATGYEGTPQVVDAASALKGKRMMRVRFDANIGGGLAWDFVPEQAQIDLRTGQTATVFFKVTNRTGHKVTAHAVYNVGPGSIGGYFDKISCFCFTDQTLDAHESVEMPVVFYLDPALEQDESMKGVDEVWLSYTFYQAKAADAGQPGRSPRL
jgi:cytochrome c oxidase assembly protein subunit 11